MRVDFFGCRKYRSRNQGKKSSTNSLISIEALFNPSVYIIYDTHGTGRKFNVGIYIYTLTVLRGLISTSIDIVIGTTKLIETEKVI